MNNPLRIVFAGTPEFAATALDALISSGRHIVGAWTQPDRPAGRGMKLTPSAVKTLALKHNIPVFQPHSLKSAEAQDELRALSPDLMIVAAYGLILPQVVLDIPRLGCLNIHGSLLPRWRGAAPIQRALLAGDHETGVCIMRMEAGLDTGAVLLERATPISAQDTSGTLHDRLAAIGAAACADVVRALQQGERAAEIPQPDEGVTYAHKISVDEAKIDWSQPADAIERAIRAFNPVPGAWTTWHGEKLKIWGAKLNEPASDLADSLSTVECGSVVRAANGLAVVCGSAQSKQLLTLLETQLAGSKRMSVQAWCMGNHSPKSGDRFGDSANGKHINAASSDPNKALSGSPSNVAG
ncbi:MAG: methionyl-tRNA formyltransferase [Burkholderiales bacterium]|nr:MAG: methionyl-tRNA formyltransferase [Betaproteobacteria bacterium]TAG82302.1 MAG: methionyl-tRNA formyltransferase [Burkholderiales bacterium]